MTNPRRSIVRTVGVGTLVVAALMTFLPGTPLGSVWTFATPFRGLVDVGGPFSEAAFRANQLPLVLALIVAVAGVTLLAVSRSMATAPRTVETSGAVSTAPATESSGTAAPSAENTPSDRR